MIKHNQKILARYQDQRHIGPFDPSESGVITATLGTRGVGDVMKLQIQLNGDGVITAAKYQTYGSGAAIACCALAAEWLHGKPVEEAKQISSQAIAEELTLSSEQLHCALQVEDVMKLLVEQARKIAIYSPSP